MNDAYDLTMVSRPAGAEVVVSHLGAFGESGDIFASATGTTPAEALRALADMFDQNDQYPNEEED